MSIAFAHIKDCIWNILKTIPDPEIPVINIVELGVVRDVDVSKNGVVITITPTYMGCPAMTFFENEIKTNLETLGYKNVKIKKIYTPAWTTDWISDEAKQKLKEYGIAPPVGKSGLKSELFQSNSTSVNCPYCSDSKTRLINEFGSTACKALYHCDSCNQPFEYFKCH